MPGRADEAWIRHGAPPLQVYPLGTIGLTTSVRTISSLPDGSLAVGSEDRLMIYDGARWTRTNGPTSAWAFLTAPNGRTYVASDNIYDLVDSPTDRHAMRNLTQANPIPLWKPLRYLAWARGTLFAQYGQSLTTLSPDGSVEHHALESWAEGVFSVGEDIFVVGGRKETLNRWNWELKKIEPVTTPDVIILDWIKLVAPRSAGGVWLVWNYNELAGFDGKKTWYWPGSYWLKEHRIQVTSLVETGTDLLAIGTAEQGLLLFTRDGQFVRSVSKEDGLGDRRIDALGNDHQGGLWVATRRALIRLDPGPQFLLFDERHGLPGRVKSLAFHRGRLHVGTSTGLYAVDPEAREKESIFIALSQPNDVRSLLSVGDDLLLSGNRLQIIDRHGAMHEFASESTSSLLRPAQTEDLVLAGTAHGILRLRRRNGTWEAEGRIEGLDRRIFGMVEAPDGTVWAGLGFGEVAQVRPQPNGGWSARVFTKSEGVPDGWMQPTLIEGQIYFNGSQSARWDATSDRFVPPSDMIYGVAGPPYGFGNVYGRSREDAFTSLNGWDGRSLRRPNARVIGQIAGQSESDDYYADCITLDEQGVAWIGGRFGLMRALDPYGPVAPPTVPPQLARVLDRDTKAAIPFVGTPGNSLTLTSRHRSVRFDLAYPDFTSSLQNHYQIYLEGFDRDWPGWSADSFREFTNLPPGNYTLNLIASNATGQVSPLQQIALHVTPPWYRTWWAWSLYALTGSLLIASFLRWRIKQLHQRNIELETTVEHRTAEIARQAQQLADTHQRLMTASRLAGMAEVATGVLHNVGNVLNSVNVSATLVGDHLRHTKAGSVAKLAALFDEHKADLADFLTKDPRGLKIPGYLTALAKSLTDEQTAVLEELGCLRTHLDQINDIVAMHQNYAHAEGVIETVAITDLVEEVLQVNASALDRPELEIVRDYQIRPVVSIDRHKAVQILINLVTNAKQACDTSGNLPQRITVRVTAGEGRIRIAVIDNGIGITAENLTRIFNQGFTTKKGGHGFGLHSGALVAKELGGSLTVQSDGLGCGATFTLELPSTPQPTEP